MTPLQYELSYLKDQFLEQNDGLSKRIKINIEYTKLYMY